ncbi:hypothetical protein LU11_gp113 [Pseudomonas phage Lu11]|uniref:hypothetical protein n=1 Tax=Pseudomonas phage Lu11 TaxID=1161927 RepID=UPI00025F154B|nr:hypothetical protein LU11_gp113 [Pseudomonas phage Lu11]AFH14644.1 hypothetical protein Lu11_0112 [Pseudomonas phage Lu11]
MGLEEINQMRLLKEIQRRIYEALHVEQTPEQQRAQMMNECQAVLERALARHKTPDFFNVKSHLVESYTIRDRKNRCEVALLDEDGKQVDRVILRGRRKANKVGRGRKHSVIVSYDWRPDRPLEKIVFKTTITRELERGIAGTG